MMCRWTSTKLSLRLIAVAHTEHSLSKLKKLTLLPRDEVTFPFFAIILLWDRLGTDRRLVVWTIWQHGHGVDFHPRRAGMDGGLVVLQDTQMDYIAWLLFNSSFFSQNN